MRKGRRELCRHCWRRTQFHRVREEGRAEYVRFVAEELIPEVAAEGLAQYCDAFCDDHAFTVEETRTVLRAAQRHGLRLRVHAEQFRRERVLISRRNLAGDWRITWRRRRMGRLNTCGLPVCSLFYLPGSVFALSRTQYPPARKMVEAGLAIVIATDFNPGSSPVPSMPLMLSLACVEMGCRRRRR